MCHTHEPGAGIVQITADIDSGKIGLMLDFEDCTYLLDASDFLRVLSENPWAEDYRGGVRHPDLSRDESTYEVCHKRGPHQHTFEDLWRFEVTSNGPEGKSVQVAVSWCACHVEFPAQIVLDLLTESYRRWEKLAMGKAALQDWMQRYRQLEQAVEFASRWRR